MKLMADTYPSIKAGTTEVKLSTGATLPLLGFGTWRAPSDQVAHAVEVALRNGYSHIDCAWAYDNEEAVGRGIKASGVARNEIFVTTKLWGTYHKRVEQGLDSSLKRLGLDYVDLFLVHWPIALVQRGEEKMPLRADGTRDVDVNRTLNEMWTDMEALLETGKVRAIGVSNVSQRKMEDLLRTAKVKPAVNQIESHPYLPEHGLIRYLQMKGITPQAYSPLGSGEAPVLVDETIVQLAQKRNVEPAQIIISWQAQRGVSVLPKSVTDSRIISNAKLITLDADEKRQMDDLFLKPGKHVRTCMPPWGVDLQFTNYPPAAA